MISLVESFCVDILDDVVMGYNEHCFMVFLSLFHHVFNFPGSISQDLAVLLYSFFSNKFQN
jgi:hypothetical protein